mgnify:CR=1 FL=1|jgi:S1-C subfamily serine protease
MKRISFISMLALAAILLSACGAPISTVQNQAARVLRQASELLADQASTQKLVSAQEPAQTQPLQPAPTATPGAPVVQLPAESAGLLSAYEGALAQIYGTVNPSVVNIRVLTHATGSSFTHPFGEGEGQMPSPDQMPFAQAQGSGFIWDNQGHIVTNNHVVDGAEKIEVAFSDGATYPAELVGTDPDSDLAVIKVDVDASRLQPIQLADSNEVKVGEIAIAIGNPYGLNGTMTVGIISAVGRTTPGGKSSMGAPSFSIPDVIQTDAPINPGNSGGPLVDDQGRVIGVTYMIESSSGANSGVGFVIPSSLVARVVPSLILNGRYEHPYLGISGMTLTPAVAEALKLDALQRGALVGEVAPGGPAEKAGLKASHQTATVDGQEIEVGGDVIIAIDGTPVNGMDDLISYLSNSTTVGQKVTLTVLRGGKETNVDVTLQARPKQQAAAAPELNIPGPSQAQPSNRPWIGITAGRLVPQIAAAMGLPEDQQGVLVEQVASGSPAAEAGLLGSGESTTINGQPVMIGGDVIVAIDGKAIDSMEDLGALLDNYKPGDKVTLTVLRDGKQIEVELTLGARPAFNLP